MFRRGGATSTGIMDGFGESTRPNFAEGDLVRQVEEEFGEPELETGFDTKDYLSLAKTMPDNIDWSLLSDYEVEDNTKGGQELACTADACEIVDIT